MLNSKCAEIEKEFHRLEPLVFLCENFEIIKWRIFNLLKLKAYSVQKDWPGNFLLLLEHLNTSFVAEDPP